MNGFRVNPLDVDAVWKHAAPLLQRAIERSSKEMDIDDVLEFIKSGRFHLWIAHDENRNITGACTIELQKHPKKVVAMIVQMGGEEGCFTVLEDIKAWARFHGADSIMLWGRKGWERALKDFGIQYRYSVMEVPL